VLRECKRKTMGLLADFLAALGLIEHPSMCKICGHLAYGCRIYSHIKSKHPKEYAYVQEQIRKKKEGAQ
jgi:hypothetical protein